MQSKQQIKAALRQSYGDVIYTLSDMSDELYFTPRPNEGWSPAEILGHLILSSKPVAKAMSTPKLMLRTTFGTSKGRVYDEGQLITTYKKALQEGLKAPQNFQYNGVMEKGRKRLEESWSEELNKLLTQVDKWSEKDLDKYQVPHPAIGKLTIREILFFTDFHTKHHHEQMREVLESVS